MTENEPVESRGAILVSPGSANLYGNGLPSMTVVEDKLPEADFQRYEAANKTLDRIIVANFFTYYVEAYKSLVEVWQDACKMFVPIIGMTDAVASLATRLRGAVLNVVSMLYHHQERTLEEVCDRYGHGAEEHLAVKRIFNALYDDHCGYRFLYKLRNVMVHDSMDAISVTVKSYKNNGDPFTDIELTLHRQTLLESPKLNAKLKAELAACAEDPNALQMMMDVARPMLHANTRALTILHPDLSSVCEAVVEFDGLFEGKEGTRGLIHQLSPELKPPFIAGFSPWSDLVFRFARHYTTENWQSHEGEV